MLIRVIIFGSVQFLSKKNNQTGLTGFGSVILEQKLVFSDLARFFLIWLGFSDLA